MKAHAGKLTEAPDLGRYSAIPQGHIAGSDGTDLTQQAMDAKAADPISATVSSAPAPQPAEETDPKFTQGSAQGTGAYRDRRDSGQAFDDAINDSSTTREQRFEAFQEYLKQRYGNQYGMVSDAAEALFNIAADLMSVDPTENPFVTYVDAFVARNRPNGRLSVDGVDALNNLYARYVINPKDLRGQTSDGRGSVIFNPSFMELPRQDAEKVASSYLWLTDPHNAGQVNFDAIRNSQNIPSDVKRALNSLMESGSKPSNDPEPWRDALIFEGGDPHGDVRPANVVMRALSEGSRRGRREGNSQEASQSAFVKSFGKLSDTQKKQAMMDLWPTISATVRAMMGDGSIK